MAAMQRLKAYFTPQLLFLFLTTLVSFCFLASQIWDNTSTPSTSVPASVLLRYSSKCAKRDYELGSIVCVCSQHHCDNFVLPDFKTALLVESTKAGKRFDYKLPKVSQEKPEQKGQRSLHVLVNTTQKWQSIIGFGGAFTDAATLNMASLTPKLWHRLIADYYSADGIEYNMGRIPISGCDFSTRIYTYDDVENDFDLKHFQLSKEDFQLKIPAIKEAMRISGKKLLFIGSSWSPPVWMKTKKNITGNATLIGPVGGKYYDIYANYLIKFIKEYKKLGVSLWGLTPVNEPTGALVANYKHNTLGMTAEMTRVFIRKNLGPALEKAGYGADRLDLLIFDDNLPLLPEYVESVLNDREAEKYVKGIAVHWYSNQEPGAYEVQNMAQKRFSNKYIINTESSYLKYFDDLNLRVALGNWERGQRYALDIIEHLNRGGVGYIDWNLALDTNGGPNWSGNLIDCPIIVNQTSNEYYKNPIFYAIGHFSKFVKPNSVRVESVVVDSQKNNVKYVTFVTPGKEIVMIAVNPDEEDCDMLVDIASKMQTVSFTISAKSFVSLVIKL